MIKLYSKINCGLVPDITNVRSHNPAQPGKSENQSMLFFFYSTRRNLKQETSTLTGHRFVING